MTHTDYLPKLRNKYPDISWSLDGDKYMGILGEKCIGFMFPEAPVRLTWINLDSLVSQLRQAVAAAGPKRDND